MTLLFDIKLTGYQRTVTLHCSHYIQGLWFCLFFCWNTHSHLSLSLWSLLLITFAENNPCAQTPPPSHSLLEEPAPALGTDDSQPTTEASPLPDGPTHGILSVGPDGLQTKQAVPSWAQFIRGGWTWIYNSCISKARTIQKLWTLYSDENILGDRCFTLDCYCCF